MNRLILIGNGFDLAHGLKTSYHDFILDYLKTCLGNALDTLKIRKESSGFRNLQHDDLIEIRVLNTDSYYYTTHPISNIEEIKHQIISADSIVKIEGLISSIGVSIGNKGDGFVKSLLNELITQRWVDIESLYYQELKKIIPQFQDYKSGKNKNDHKVISRIKNLNAQLDFIKEKLEKYLISVVSNGDCYIDEYKNIFLTNQISLGYNLRPQNSLILNFNYTSTPNKYVIEHNFEIINIHGKLTNETSPIIFGYGDEIDKNYKEIEDLNENEFFKHIKSFDYFKTSNYNNLLSFIEADEFEIFTIGHSCGLSDRTMLSTIFEHPNCKSIRIFYHDGYNDYRNKTYEISRHFNDKAAMRRKIVPFPDCVPMPQHND